ncbi:hypothetical protein JY651_25040 [Pyxidicoccus parkwayensis]|jgi:Domain of unknown function (DUF6891)|uniref:DUF6891 domain-containing protein n=1 Tax=Pyxidicoccus parkwayensis TaxID=2813578 RepID=A0ABX7PDZ0_9BACT|nr:hypothetical protein [Pyxidicoccus parkwaysis]QSQ28617.1 hypothetical protein JY651_25040 [Pyxidicoccus parkwaysis]
MATAPEVEQYLRNSVKTAVLGGDLSEEAVLAHVQELVEDEPEAGPELVESLLEFARQMIDEGRAEEERWIGLTMNDRIDRASSSLVVSQRATTSCKSLAMSARSSMASPAPSSDAPTLPLMSSASL